MIFTYIAYCLSGVGIIRTISEKPLQLKKTLLICLDEQGLFLCPFFSYPFPILQLRQQLPQIGAHLLLCVCILWHIFHAHLNQILHIAIQIYTIGVAPFAVILIQKAICFPADAVIRKRHAAALANQLSRRAKQCVDGHIEQLG